MENKSSLDPVSLALVFGVNASCHLAEEHEAFHHIWSWAIDDLRRSGLEIDFLLVITGLIRLLFRPDLEDHEVRCILRALEGYPSYISLDSLIQLASPHNWNSRSRNWAIEILKTVAAGTNATYRGRKKAALALQRIKKSAELLADYKLGICL